MNKMDRWWNQYTRWAVKEVKSFIDEQYATEVSLGISEIRGIDTCSPTIGDKELISSC